MNRAQKIAKIKAITAQPEVITIFTIDGKNDFATGKPPTPEQIKGIRAGSIIFDWDYSNMTTEVLRKLAAGENPFND